MRVGSKVIEDEIAQYGKLPGEEVISAGHDDHSVGPRPRPVERRVQRHTLVTFPVHDERVREAIGCVVSVATLDLAEGHAGQANAPCRPPQIREAVSDAGLHERSEGEAYQGQPG